MSKNKIAIIGAGMAGASLAYLLKREGMTVTLYEAAPHPASGASGNALGLYNPRICAHAGIDSTFYTAAFHEALEIFPQLQKNHDVAFNPCGILHLIHDDKKEKRYNKAVTNWAWPNDTMRIVTATEASTIAGIDIQYEALHLPQAGSISPQKLCAAYLDNIDVHYNTEITDLNIIDADIIVLANATNAAKFAKDIPIKAVRGQTTQIKSTPQSKALKCALSYSGYIAPASNGTHEIGSTFQRKFDAITPTNKDDKENLQNLKTHLPSLLPQNAEFEISNHRASLRATVQDYLPAIGHYGDNIYITTAHGSHGILSTLAAASILRDQILNRSPSIPENILKALSPHRFF